MRLIPAILSDTLDDYRRKLMLAELLSGTAQVDFADGRFVPMNSISPVEAASITTSLRLDAHLMVSDPVSYLKPLKDAVFKRVFFHYEAVSDHRETINKIRELGFEVGLAVNPGTSVGKLLGLAKDVDSVLFLAVNPQVNGSPFELSVLEKLKGLRMLQPGIESGIDGGVRLELLNDIIDAKPDFICVGRAVFDVANPEDAFKEFETRLQPFGLSQLPRLFGGIEGIRERKSGGEGADDIRP
ncbi:MAG: hypothetical protein COW32_04490 [Candidatus Aquicultor secundus]|uniref:Ribulose-phosphate 3-epimerase n=1 Tax=Candidatus Aquicultor secundus TaxID=1973895 RepID=A0A2M7T5Y7_9ACTN|nr:hypothetical protein [Candidatus Aquicultor secundus]NCO65880.1 hypothetical protein [Solirubrobacter sp.]OIO86983.1 MAG: hypothetical protein AUK32_04685 [Candidatus Aquicultor secundus]PIU26685.1 MAG: hypothetical protein COT10_07380 [Candidatus Aquicultor secundus]PIW22459.1 MAG: hypothetical protein COW32_04490 [Candidatus Aquicultor secundus]PIX52809.1 MAG: hypothetical protein COZ51_02135 [Candidatus Aquicultor secundus]